MKEFVVDTNVAAVAQGFADQADQTCVDACQDWLIAIMRDGGLILDDGRAIVGQYTKVLGFRGRPGLGEKFAKWANDRQFDTTCCRLVHLTPTKGQSWREFEEVPDLPSLRSFDRDEHKFVAAAVVGGPDTQILHAQDSDWDHHAAILQGAGIHLIAVCKSGETVKRRYSRRRNTHP
ncbi:MAG: hypothetical protein HZA52_09280 [Planctomycetes bacterium]|nr:hypothetical protein [Planctomycetota bacterium]